jgi:hypothetical protein
VALEKRQLKKANICFGRSLIGEHTRSKFIAVCVTRQRERAVVRFEAEFTTDWAPLLAARQWITDTLGLRPGSPFRSCIESTGTYHFPVPHRR